MNVVSNLAWTCYLLSLLNIMTATTARIVSRLDSSYFIEHVACVDFTELLFLHYPFNQTGLGLTVLWSH